MEKLILEKMREDMLEECVDLYMDTFSKEPWNDVYESRDQVRNFFLRHFASNYFLGYVLKIDGR